MRKYSNKHYFILALSLVFLLFSFQNCSVSKVSFQSLSSLQGEKSAPESDGVVSGGNGGGYEGKPDGIFLREIPNFKCFDQSLKKSVSAPAAKLEISTTNTGAPSASLQTAKLTINDERQCLQSTQQPSVGRIISSQFSQMQNEVIALDDGLYRNILATQKNANLLSEAWCRGVDSQEKLEVLVHHELNMTAFTSEIYFDKLKLSQIDPVTSSPRISSFQKLTLNHSRKISRQKINYASTSTAQSFSLEIDAQKTKAASSGQFKAQVKFIVNQESIERTLSCHLGAELDGRIWPSPLLTGLKIIQSKSVAQSQKLLFIGEDAFGARSLYLWTFAKPQANTALPQIENILPLNSSSMPSQQNAGSIASFILSADEQNLVFASDYSAGSGNTSGVSSPATPSIGKPLQLYQLLNPQLNVQISSQLGQATSRQVRKLSGDLVVGAQGVASDYSFSQDGSSIIYKDGETSQDNPHMKAVSLASGVRTFFQDALSIVSGLNIGREFLPLTNKKTLSKIGLGFAGSFFLFDESQSLTTSPIKFAQDLQITKLLPPGCYLPANSNQTFSTHPFITSNDETSLYFAADCTSSSAQGALTLPTRLFKADISAFTKGTTPPTAPSLETLITNLNATSTLEQSDDGQYLHVALNSGVTGHDDHKLIHLPTKNKIPLGDVLDFQFVSSSRAIVISWFGDPNNPQDLGETKVGYVDLFDQNVNWSQTLAQRAHIEKLKFDRDSLGSSTVNLLWPDLDGVTKVVAFNFVTGQSQVLAQFTTPAKRFSKIHVSQKSQRVIFMADQENDGNNELYVFDWSRTDSPAVLLMINDRYVEYGSVQSFSELTDGRIIFESGPLSAGSTPQTTLFEWRDEP